LHRRLLFEALAPPFPSQKNVRGQSGSLVKPASVSVLYPIMTARNNNWTFFAMSPHRLLWFKQLRLKTERASELEPRYTFGRWNEQKTSKPAAARQGSPRIGPLEAGPRFE